MVLYRNIRAIRTTSATSSHIEALTSTFGKLASYYPDETFSLAVELDHQERAAYEAILIQSMTRCRATSGEVSMTIEVTCSPGRTS